MMHASQSGIRADKPPASPGPEASGRGAKWSCLRGVRVLLVEDEAFLALDLRDTLEEAGAEVVGPIVSLTDAIRAAQTELFDAAILDIDLQGHDVFPAARIILDRKVPFVFHTAHGQGSNLPPPFSGVTTCSKPIDPIELLQVLANEMEHRRSVR